MYVFLLLHILVLDVWCDIMHSWSFIHLDIYGVWVILIQWVVKWKISCCCNYFNMFQTSAANPNILKTDREGDEWRWLRFDSRRNTFGSNTYPRKKGTSILYAEAPLWYNTFPFPRLVTPAVCTSHCTFIWDACKNLTLIMFDLTIYTWVHQMVLKRLQKQELAASGSGDADTKWIRWSDHPEP